VSTPPAPIQAPPAPVSAPIVATPPAARINAREINAEQINAQHAEGRAGRDISGRDTSTREATTREGGGRERNSRRGNSRNNGENSRNNGENSRNNGENSRNNTRENPAAENLARESARAERPAPIDAVVPAPDAAVAILDIPVTKSQRSTRRISTHDAEQILDSVLDALPEPKQPGQGRSRVSRRASSSGAGIITTEAKD
jgi:ribonuclease E